MGQNPKKMAKSRFWNFSKIFMYVIVISMQSKLDLNFIIFRQVFYFGRALNIRTSFKLGKQHTYVINTINFKIHNLYRKFYYLFIVFCIYL